MSVKSTKRDLIRPLMRSNIKAKDIVRALTQKDNGPERLILRHKKIRGRLDLKDRLITIPVTLRNCEFLDAVDLRNCEFKQAIDFTRCVFYELFNSGDEYSSHTVYKRDFICNEAVFKSSVGFDGSHFEGVASFSKAVFESKEKMLTFRGTSFEDSLRCDATTFKGAADFSYVKCDGNGNFTLAKFEGEEESANFIGASFGGILACDGAIFKGAAKFSAVKCELAGLFCPAKPEDGGEEDARHVSFEESVDFRFASFGRTLQCNEAAFKEEADFTAVKCGDYGFFTKASFEKSVDFGFAFFGAGLACDEAIFRETANFSYVKCDGNGSFTLAKFEGEEKSANFIGASFGGILACEEAIFKGAARFGYLKCGGDGNFTLAKFEGEEESANFIGASFGGTLICVGAIFKGAAHFGHVRCEGGAIFRPAKSEDGDSDGVRHVSFEKSVDFRFAYFGVNLECSGATFKERATFAAIRCGDDADLSSSKFESEDQLVDSVCTEQSASDGSTVEIFNGPVNFYNATLGILTLGHNCRFAPETLSLRELTFKRFDGTPEQAKQLVEAQNPAWFSRGPYIQLEQYYSSVGKDAQAKDIYYQGHQASRENAKKENGSVEWSRGTDALDWLWKTLTRYGISVWRLLAIAIALVSVGTLVFYLPDLYLSQDALKLASDSASTAPWEQGWPYRAAYSLDLFLPLVNLHIDEKWMPTTPLLQAYAIFHSMIGWLIVPLLIAALAGIMRR